MFLLKVFYSQQTEKRKDIFNYVTVIQGGVIYIRVTKPIIYFEMKL